MLRYGIFFKLDPDLPFGACRRKKNSHFLSIIQHIRNAEEQGTSRSEMIRRVITGEGTGSLRVPHQFINTPYHGPSGAITLDVNGDRKDG